MSKILPENLTRQGKYLSSPPHVLSVVASQFLWYNEYIKIDNNSIYNCCFSQKNLNHISDFFENDGKIKRWEDLRAKLGLVDNKKFYWRKIIHAITRAWKKMFLECGDNINDLIINKHNLIKKHQIYCLEKLNNGELYNMQLIFNVRKPTAQTYFEKKFKNLDLEWIYIPYLDK